MNKTAIFRDPIYNLIIFELPQEQILVDLINSTEFQRLKRIRQLGLSYTTYSSAIHDRFSHSIGVAYLVGLMYDKLNIPQEIQFEDHLGKHVLKKDELKLLIKIAALLHDLGHGPFSHAFEKITKVDHENITVDLIVGEEFSIRGKIEKIEKNENIAKNGVQWVKDLIRKTFPIHWAVELISSQLDADRMDYLLRDAYMCGVKYANFDWQWILNHMEIKKHNSGLEVIAIDARKGIHSIESFIISRYHMYEQVYYHKTTRSFEVLIKKIFERVNALIENTDKIGFLSDYLKSFFKNRDNKSFLMLDDFHIITHISIWADSSKDEILKTLSKNFIERIPWKMLKEGKGSGIINQEGWEKIIEKIPEKSERYYFLGEDDYTQNAYKDDYLLGKMDGERDSSDQNIWLIDGSGSLPELSTQSTIIGSIKNKTTKTNRFYISREKAELFKEYKF